uniref:Uncharacterized protein n=1 Tax=Rhizophora mucronata TaxID=61149 RepID=A0A2P2MGK4_RHIMU
MCVYIGNGEHNRDGFNNQSYLKIQTKTQTRNEHTKTIPLSVQHPCLYSIYIPHMRSLRAREYLSDSGNMVDSHRHNAF